MELRKVPPSEEAARGNGWGCFGDFGFVGMSGWGGILLFWVCWDVGLGGILGLLGCCFFGGVVLAWWFWDVGLLAFFVSEHSVFYFSKNSSCLAA